MKKLFIVLVLSILFAGTANAADFNRFNGTWVYTNAQMAEITKILVAGDGKYHAQAWEKCSSGTCDYGGLPCNSYSDGHLFFSYESNSGKKEVSLRVTGVNTLEVIVNNHTYTFRRSPLKPTTSQPIKPMDRITPKPVDRVYPTPSTSTDDEPTGKY